MFLTLGLVIHIPIAPESLALVFGPLLVRAIEHRGYKQGRRKRSVSESMVTVTGQVLLLLGALLGAGGGLRYLVEPTLRRKRLRKVMATGLWLSCSDLRSHLASLKDALAKNDEEAARTRDALLKIPRNDFGNRPDWFVKAATSP